MRVVFYFFGFVLWYVYNSDLIIFCFVQFQIQLSFAITFFVSFSNNNNNNNIESNNFFLYISLWRVKILCGNVGVIVGGVDVGVDVESAPGKEKKRETIVTYLFFNIFFFNYFFSYVFRLINLISSSFSIQKEKPNKIRIKNTEKINKKKLKTN